MRNGIFCLSCGKMFRDIESAREHEPNCSCGSQKPLEYFIPSITIIPWEEINKYLTQNKNKKWLEFERLCPLNKPFTFGTPPCPQCHHCEKLTDLGEFFKATVRYNCRYPDIVSKSTKQISLEKREVDSEHRPFSQATWDCPFCHKLEVIHYDYRKQVFVCLNCVIIIQFNDGIKILDGLETYCK
jgi:hypothetical protein